LLFVVPVSCQLFLPRLRCDGRILFSTTNLTLYFVTIDCTNAHCCLKEAYQNIFNGLLLLAPCSLRLRLAIGSWREKEDPSTTCEVGREYHDED
jgi:hypothetical protein